MRKNENGPFSCQLKFSIMFVLLCRFASFFFLSILRFILCFLSLPLPPQPGRLACFAPILFSTFLFVPSTVGIAAAAVAVALSLLVHSLAISTLRWHTNGSNFLRCDVHVRVLGVCACVCRTSIWSTFKIELIESFFDSLMLCREPATAKYIIVWRSLQFLLNAIHTRYTCMSPLHHLREHYMFGINTHTHTHTPGGRTHTTYLRVLYT